MLASGGTSTTSPRKVAQTVSALVPTTPPADTSRSTSTTSPRKVAQTASAPVPATPPAHKSRSRTLSAISIDLELLELILDPTPPSPDAPSFTQTETAPSTTLDGQGQTVDSLADALDGLSTDDTAAAVPLPTPLFTPTGGHRRYYSITVRKCCGVFQQW